MRRAGRRVQARTELERALDLAYRLGARRIAAHARAELTAAGAKPRRDAITGQLGDSHEHPPVAAAIS